MRLTLRTLLAYLDNILDAEDAEVLGKKIDESEFATSLVHQIQGSVRRLRLDAPALDAQGIGGDLNSVAEYLDNVLPPEQVPALEKACLDSDVNLGEVASCHQVLTLVLGQAAPVTEAMRRRTYGISPTAGGDELPPTTPIPGVADGSYLHSHPAHDAVPASKGNVESPAARPANTGDTAITNKVSGYSPTPSPAMEGQVSPSVSSATSPSTRETWRAESQSLDANEATTPDSEQTARDTAEESKNDASPTVETIESNPPTASVMPEAAVPSTSQAATLPGPRDYPDYMPRKSSWLRSAVLTAVVALLIVAGLLLATGTLDDNIVTRWMNNKRDQVVSDLPENDSTVSVPLPSASTPVESNGQSSAELVKPNLQQPNLQQPNLEEPNLQEPRLIPEDRIPTFDAATTTPSEPVQPEAFFQPTEDLPELIVSNDGFRDVAPEPIFEEPTPEPVLPDLEAQPAAKPRPTEPDPLVVVEDVAPIAAPPTEALSEHTPDPIARATDNEPLPTLPPSVESASPQPGPIANVQPSDASSFDEVQNPASSSRLAEESIIPLDSQGLDTTPVAEPLEPVELEPPVAASPATPSVNDLAVTTRLPVEQKLPETTTPTFEPTKLKRDDQLLLLFDSTTQSWVRADSKVLLREGDNLLGLPSFKADIEIGDKMECSVHGVGRLRLGPNSDISLLDGRLVLRNLVADQSQTIHLPMQGEKATVTMHDRDTNVAIEAYHRYFPGADYTDRENLHSVMRIHAIDGPVSVELMGKTFEVPVDKQLVAVDGYEPQIRKSTPSTQPKWRLRDSRNPADLGAIRVWKTQLSEVEDVQGWLHTKADRKIKSNQRALATRCLAEMDDFSSIVVALSDEAQRAYWDEHFEALQRALTRGTATQRLLQLELEKTYDDTERAELMLEMIRGYDQRQLVSGDAKSLVQYLDHPVLELRVLAIQNLTQITGKNLGFKPDESLHKRTAASGSWRRLLKSGRVSYRKNIPEIEKLVQSFEDAL